MEPSHALTLDEIDLSDPLFWARPLDEREGAFLTLREQDPIRFFDEPIVSEMFPPGPGYYSLTRNAISHGLLALTQHPEERRRWMTDFDGMAPMAVEEIVRWATPVIHFRRTCTEDGVQIGGQTFNTGDKVVLWYASANRDAAVFEDPFRFDVGRTPNDHLGFGGPGRTSVWAPTWLAGRSR